MANSKYSNDYTIEVTGDTKTVTVKDNLVVVETITASNLTITESVVIPNLEGSLNIEGSLTVEGNLTVTDIAADDIVVDTASRNSPEEKYINMPASAFNFLGDWSAYASLFVFSIDSAGDGVTVSGSDSWNGAHSLHDLPNNSTIESLYVYFTPANASGFSVQAQIWKRNLVTGIASVVATASTTTGSAAIFNVEAENNIEVDVNNELNAYWVVLSATAGAGTLEVHNVRIYISVTDYD